ncbi:hypothetical protein MACH09_40280 [Vibrio sp. MACH09]|nr:hypothetical protein MACH09_40280 [Vibrio sp. MACH09]
MNRQFSADAYNAYWVTDVSFIRSHQRCHYSYHAYKDPLSALDIKQSVNLRGNSWYIEVVE